MEAKLAAYRAKKEEQKRAEQSFFNRVKAQLLGRKEAKPDIDTNSKSTHDKNIEREATGDPIAVPKEIPVENNAFNLSQETKEDEEPTRSEIITKWVLRVCKLALWLCLWGLFVELQFGAVFFAISAILFTYMNTRTGPRDGRLSAYSVFNKDCERIQGTLTAEQMQRNMFGVPGVTS